MNFKKLFSLFLASILSLSFCLGLSGCDENSDTTNALKGEEEIVVTAFVPKNPEKDYTAYTFSPLGSEGERQSDLIPISINIDGKNVDAFIGSSIVPIYICDEGEKLINCPESSNSLGYTEKEVKGKKVITLITGDGRIVKEFNKGEEVLALIGDKAVISKTKNSPYNYGVIDSKGEWTIPYKESTQKYNFASVGKNFFCQYATIKDSDGKIKEYTVESYKNVDTDASFQLVYDGKYEKHLTFDEGKIIYIGDNKEKTIAKISLSNGETKNLPNEFILESNGKITNLPKNFPDLKEYSLSNSTYLYKIKNNTLDIYDLNTYTYQTFENEKISTITNATFFEDYCLVEFEDSKQQNYFTVIDIEGEMLFDPIESYGEVNISDNNIITYESKTGYNTTDISGKFKYENLDCKAFPYFRQGIALVTDNGSSKVINIKGEVLYDEIIIKNN